MMAYHMHDCYANYWRHCDKQHRASTYLWERKTSDQQLKWSMLTMVLQWEPGGGNTHLSSEGDQWRLLAGRGM